MSANQEWPSEANPETDSPDGLRVSKTPIQFLTLGCLPIGARLILRAKKDWREATIVAVVEEETIVLSVASPTGRMYRLRRPTDTPIELHGPIPLMGKGAWQASLAKYDDRW